MVKCDSLQMATQEGSNVAVAGILGNFDDAQSGVKKIFTDNDWPTDNIRIYGVGDTECQPPTHKNADDPACRRVEITIESGACSTTQS